MRSVGQVDCLPPALVPVDGHRPLTVFGHHHNLPPHPPRAPHDTAHGTLSMHWCNSSSDSTQLYTDVIGISMILRCTLVQ